MLFRFALTLGLLLGVGSGFMLGYAMVRVNTLFLPIGMALVGLPAAFLGCAIVSNAFRRLMARWHRVASLLVIYLFVSIGTPLGLAWAVFEQQLDPVELLNSTGATIWYLQGLFALLGLIGGTWSGWTRPFSERLEHLVNAITAPPLAALRFIVSIPGRVLDALATFFESVGRGFLWLPLQMIRILRDGYQKVRVRIQQFWTPTPAPPRRRRRTESRPQQPRTRLRLPRMPSRKRSNGDEGLRVLQVVEERCPYCFDVIKRQDPRGVKTCQVCGAPHHADCWAITGRCQVPHLNT